MVKTTVLERGGIEVKHVGFKMNRKKQLEAVYKITVSAEAERRIELEAIKSKMKTLELAQKYCKHTKQLQQITKRLGYLYKVYAKMTWRKISLADAIKATKEELQK